MLRIVLRKVLGQSARSSQPGHEPQVNHDLAQARRCAVLDRIRAMECAAVAGSTVFTDVVGCWLSVLTSLVRDYEELVLQLAVDLTPGNLPVAVEIAELSGMLWSCDALSSLVVERQQARLQELHCRFDELTTSAAWI
jgi:hypothetical protein